MKQFLLCLFLVFLSFWANVTASDEQPVLTKDSINEFLQASRELAQLRQKLPELQKFSDEKAAQSTEQIVAYLQASEAYPDIQDILSSKNFDNLIEFFDFSERLMAVRLYLQMENSTQATIFQTVDILQANLNSMKANNASKEIIQKAELVLQQQQQKAALIKASLDKLDPQDKQFAIQNQQWLIELFSQ